MNFWRNSFVAIFLGSFAIAAPHPHGDLPLWTYTRRAVALLEGKPGNMAITRLERAFARAALGAESQPAPGAFVNCAKRWAARGQVDLLQHLLQVAKDNVVTDEDAAPHLRMCEICRAFTMDSIFGDASEVQKTPVGKNHILLITAHQFLEARRDYSKLGSALQKAPAAPAKAAASLSFFSDLNKQSGKAGVGGMVIFNPAVPWRIGFMRLDLDDDGTAETEALDLDDDGKFEVLHVDRNRDGAFELEAVASDSGIWNITNHGTLLDVHLRALRAFQSTDERNPAGRIPGGVVELNKNPDGWQDPKSKQLK